VIRVLAAACVLAALLAGCGGGGHTAAVSTTAAQAPAPTGFRGLLLRPPLRAPDFALRDQAGKLVRLSDFRGGYAIVTFLYTHCPDVCPLIANELQGALGRLGPNVHVLAVSVDPKGDTPASVRRFVRLHRLGPRFRYLTGTRAKLAPVWRGYHIAATPDGSTVDHSAFELLVDPKGHGVVLWDARVRSSDVVHDIRRLERGG
jgi:protein SCO1/2